MFNSAQLSIMKRRVKRTVVCLLAREGESVGLLPSLLCICQHCVCVCLCASVCPCQLGASFFTTSSDLLPRACSFSLSVRPTHSHLSLASLLPRQMLCDTPSAEDALLVSYIKCREEM